MQSLQHSIPATSDENTVQPTYQIIGLGFYTTPGGTLANTPGFYIDELSISSEKRNFAWENVRLKFFSNDIIIIGNFHIHALKLLCCSI